MDEKNNIGEKPLNIRRGQVNSVDLYEIKDSELDLLEKGSPTGIYLNFSIFLLSMAFSAIIALCTSTFNDTKIETVFIMVSVIGVLLGTFLLILWWRTRTSVSKAIKIIRKRIPPDQEVLSDTDNSISVFNIETTKPKG